MPCWHDPSGHGFSRARRIYKGGVSRSSAIGGEPRLAAQSAGDAVRTGCSRPSRRSTTHTLQAIKLGIEGPSRRASASSATHSIALRKMTRWPYVWTKARRTDPRIDHPLLPTNQPNGTLALHGLRETGQQDHQSQPADLQCWRKPHRVHGEQTPDTSSDDEARQHSEVERDVQDRTA